MNWRYITGAATILVIVGGTAYAIKKSLDGDKSDGGIMTVEDARAEVYARKDRESRVDEALNSVEFGEIVDDIRDTANWNRSFMPYGDEGDSDEEEDRRNGMDIDGEKEDKEMMHEPSSIEARNQYIRMELAEWSMGEETYAILDRLFEFPFNPKTDGDHDLKTHIIDYRVNFFGFGSKWAKEVTFAEVILHYARLANYNCNETVRYWVDYFLQFIDFNQDTPSRNIDSIIEALNSHLYVNEDTATFGLFGLTSEQMNSAINIANKNIDKSLTYEIEFNEFLKGCI